GAGAARRGADFAGHRAIGVGAAGGRRNARAARDALALPRRTRAASAGAGADFARQRTVGIDAALRPAAGVAGENAYAVARAIIGVAEDAAQMRSAACRDAVVRRRAIGGGAAIADHTLALAGTLAGVAVAHGRIARCVDDSAAATATTRSARTARSTGAARG